MLDDVKPAVRLSGSSLWVPSLALVSVLTSGYRFFCDNHALQIPRVQKILNPDLFPGDPFTETLSSFVSWVWWLVAQISRFVDLELVLLAFFVASRLLLVYACARLAATLFQGSKIAPLCGAALASLVPESILADGTLTEVYFEQTSLFVAVFLLALAELLAGRPRRFFVLWGIAYVVNPMYGSWAALFFAATFAADPERLPIGRMVRSAPIFLLLAAPILVSGLRAFLQPNPSPELWALVMRLLNSPHLAPATWPREVWHSFSIFMVLVGAMAVVVKRREPRVTRLMLTWSGFAVAAVGLGVWAAVSRVGLGLLSLQPARATDLYYLSAGVAAVSAAGFLAEARSSAGALALASLSIGATAYLLSPSFRSHGAGVFAVAGVIGTTVVAVSGLLERKRSTTRSPKTTVAASTIVLLLVVASTGTAAGSLLQRSENLGSLRVALYRGPSPQVSRIADWARNSTDAGAVFFHDPISWDWAQFRYLSNRPVYVTWKDGSAVQWEPAYVLDWSRRFAALGFKGRWRDRWDVGRSGEVRRIRQSLKLRYKRLADGDVSSMRSDFQIDYWVAPAGVPTSWPVVFKTDDYQVIELPSGQPRSR